MAVGYGHTPPSTLRLLYYLPMERMTKGEWMTPEEYVAMVEEENKKLKKYYDRDKEELMESCYWLARENDELKEENKKLKSDLAFERTMLDNVRAEYKSLQNVIKKLKEELSKLKEKYWDIDY